MDVNYSKTKLEVEVNKSELLRLIERHICFTRPFIRTGFAIRHPRITVEVGDAGRVGTFFIEAQFASEHSFTLGREAAD